MAERNCPNCGSKNVEPDLTETTAFSHGNVNDWICNNCGYRGIMPEGELDEDIEFEEPEKEQIKEVETYKFRKYMVFIIIFLLTAILIYMEFYYI